MAPKSKQVAAASATAATSALEMPPGVPDPTEGHSARYTYFFRALQLASQKLSTKWSENDFAQCFPTWAHESPQGVAQVRVQIGEHIRDQIVEQSQPILDSYRAAEGIDALSEVIQAAKARMANGKTQGTDVWKEGLTPQILIGARTGKVLQGEKERLEGLLKELEEENRQLYGSLQEKRAARSGLSKQLDSYLSGLDEAMDHINVLPLDEASEWMEAAVDPVPIQES